MRWLVLVICFSACLGFKISAQSYGLKFNSHEAVPEKRTSLELAPSDSLQFSKNLRLNFDLNFIRGHEIYFGYVLRIINDHQNIDIIYDQSKSLFRVINGQQFSGISFSLDSAHLFNAWNTISIAINKDDKKLSLRVNNKPIGSAAISLKSNQYKFLWGANDYNNYQTRDIPPMRIKDIKLFDESGLKYNWLLDETNGNTSLDAVHKQKAFAKNAVWIKPAHQNWAQVNAYSTNGNVVTAFDAATETLYIAGSDSVMAYSLKNINNAWKKYPVAYNDLLLGSQCIYDTLTHKLYDIFIDEKKAISYRPGDAKWSDKFTNIIETEYGHANKFISKADTAIYIVGGYGQLKYKNIVQRYSIPNNTWEVIPAKGDFFPPRYLAALGLNETGDTAFIIGGYGSTTGDQMLNPGNYSDMYAFDIRNRSFKKLFNLDTLYSKYTFANSLVIDSKNQQYFGLVFPNDSFNSSLQLIQGSLKNNEVKLLGTKIPYSFYDARSFVDLYYAPTAGKLVAVTLFGPKFESNDKTSLVNIYTLDFPPDAAPAPPGTPTSPSTKYFLFALAAVTIVLVAVVTIKRRKQAVAELSPEQKQPEEAIIHTIPPPGVEEVINGVHRETPVIEVEQPAEVKSRSSIFLFGQFQVFDKEANDITELFTPLIKELFLLILIYTFKNGRGITSEELNEILWSGKSVKDAKNNRSVNMTKLKSIIERVGDCVIAKKSNFWQFQVLNEPVYVDYVAFTQLVKESPASGHNHIRQILKIAGKQAFLFQTEYNWLDPIKADVSNSIIDVCLGYIHRMQSIYDDPELVIELSNCIFHFDHLNEDALEYKCKCLIYLKRHAIANKTYTRFLKDYKDMYGEEFERPFTEIIKNDSHSHLKME